MNIVEEDRGHLYYLPNIDGPGAGMINFVKRIGPKFPGNRGKPIPGVTLQMVLRACLKRVRFLQRQVWSLENVFLMKALQTAIWLLEFRAARRHGRKYFHGLTFASGAPMCEKCGHTVCNCH